jgi:hypothetical protein
MLMGIVGTASLFTGIGALAGVLAMAAVAIAVTASTASDAGRG